MRIELLLLRNCVAAKQDYWDALRALEDATVPGDGPDYSDSVSDKVDFYIDMLAACGDVETITDAEVDGLLKLIDD